MFDNTFLEEMKANLLKIKGDFKEVYLENSNLTKTFLYEGKWRYMQYQNLGISLRVERQEQTLFKKKKSNNLNTLLNFVKNFDYASCKENKAKPVKRTYPLVQPSPPISIENLNEIEKAFTFLLKNKEENIKFDPVISFCKSDISIINSEDILVRDKRYSSTIYIAVRGKSFSSGAEAFIINGKRNLSEIEEKLKEAYAEAKRLALFRKNATKKILGEMPVAFSSRAGGYLLNEALSHFFEADLEEKTKFSQFLNQKIFNDSITIFDGGPLPGIAEFDDEGVKPIKPLVMVEKGKVVNLLTHRKSGSSLSLKRSGNARRSYYKCQPVVGVWNINLLPSKYEEMELVENIPFGLYIKRIGDGSVSLRKGKFSFPVIESYVIRNGKIAEGVTNVKIFGETPQFINDIEMIGNKVESFGGFRKKGKSSYYKTFETVPPFLIKKLWVSPIK